MVKLAGYPLRVDPSVNPGKNSDVSHLIQLGLKHCAFGDLTKYLLILMTFNCLHFSPSTQSVVNLTKRCAWTPKPSRRLRCLADSTWPQTTGRTASSLHFGGRRCGLRKVCNFPTQRSRLTLKLCRVFGIIHYIGYIHTNVENCCPFDLNSWKTFNFKYMM